MPKTGIRSYTTKGRGTRWLAYFYGNGKHVLFGQQEGLCTGCKGDFPFKLFEVDHRIPRSSGGTDHLDNLQLMCGHCNKVKGDQPMEYLIARLKEIAVAA